MGSIEHPRPESSQFLPELLRSTLSLIDYYSRMKRQGLCCKNLSLRSAAPSSRLRPN
jgi:hypothetical protein